MGVLEVLTDLESCLPIEAQSQLEHLSDTEETQIGQALGVALRSLVTLRKDSALARGA